MTVHELNRDQLIQLKQRYLQELEEFDALDSVLPGVKRLGWGALADADELVTDECVFLHWDGTDFVEEDF